MKVHYLKLGPARQSNLHRETPRSVGIDIPVPRDVLVDPHALVTVPLGIVVQPPEGYFVVIALRSSVPQKWRVMMPEGIAIIDPDYCGPTDQIHLTLVNFTGQAVQIPRETYLAQAFLLPKIEAEWIEVDQEDWVADQNRGTSLKRTDRRRKD